MRHYTPDKRSSKPAVSSARPVTFLDSEARPRGDDILVSQYPFKRPELIKIDDPYLAYGVGR